MNFLKKGPELKLSGIRVPAFLQDVYYDLKDRHLLPVAAILLVAIVAVPIAVASSGSETETPSERGESGATMSTGGEEPDTLVAESTPGLRDYRRRLNHQQATDPFKEKYADSEQPSEGSGEGGSETAAGGIPSSTESPGSTTFPPSEPSDEGNSTPGKLTYYSYAIDVRISGGSEGKKATVRKNLPELTMLPSRETPAIVYMGSTRDGKKAVMTVSSDVQAIFGDAKCVLGSETCQLLAMEPGLPQTFVYGGAGKTYKIELLKIHLVESDKLNRALLGEPKKNNGNKGD
ncbi:MAG: hypothetical protein JJE35_07575 [Thermoleophilia bacterium]|nr:hypothetical protein [Thermoleophilia bacterium]